MGFNERRLDTMDPAGSGQRTHPSTPVGIELGGSGTDDSALVPCSLLGLGLG